MTKPNKDREGCEHTEKPFGCSYDGCSNFRHLKDREGVEGYMKVRLFYAPEDGTPEFSKWCEEHGFRELNRGRRAWHSGMSTYLRGAAGVAYTDSGEGPFLFYKEDLAAANIASNKTV